MSSEKRDKRPKHKRTENLGPQTPNTKTEQKRRGKQRRYESVNELLSKFYLEPALEDHGFDDDKFGHINKNLVVTALSRKHGESQRVLRLLNAVQVLLNFNRDGYNAYLPGKDQPVKVSERQAAALIQHDDYQGRIEPRGDNRFERALNVFYGNIYAQTAVSAGTGSSLIRNLNTDIGESKQEVKQEQVSDRRSMISRFTGGNN